MSGTLGLSSPWCRQGLPIARRPEVEAAVPDGHVLGVACGSSGPGKPWIFRLMTQDVPRDVLWGPFSVWNLPLWEAALFALDKHARDAA